MAIARVQGPYYGTHATAPAAVFGATPTEGNLLIAWMSGTNDIANGSISEWTLAVSVVMISGGRNMGLWYKVAGAGESTTVTGAWTSSTLTELQIEEWSGLATSNVLDKVAYTTGTGSTVTSRSSGTTATTSQAEELAIVGVVNGAIVTNQAWTNSFTVERHSSCVYQTGGSKVLSSAAAIESTMSWTTARHAGGVIATFAAPAAGGTVVPVMMNQYRQRRA